MIATTSRNFFLILFLDGAVTFVHILQAKSGDREDKIGLGENLTAGGDTLLTIAVRAFTAYEKLVAGLEVTTGVLKLISVTLLTTKAVNKEGVETINSAAGSVVTIRRKEVDLGFFRGVEFRVINDIAALVPRSSQGFFSL